uniref:Uncharacterized protein n=1 Tax=Schistocephalus solidus TaxID=70667 RepID=A0A0X3NL85_SCHSO
MTRIFRIVLCDFRTESGSRVSHLSLIKLNTSKSARRDHLSFYPRGSQSLKSKLPRHECIRRKRLVQIRSRICYCIINYLRGRYVALLLKVRRTTFQLAKESLD